jgi:protein-S-isoprenylcysteine O-methyltransferase Ste14
MRWGRAYFAVQALAGGGWWITVFTIPIVRQATIGSLDPVVLAILDIPLFVVGSALAALGVRFAAVVTTAWTAVVAVCFGAYAAITGEAGWGVILMIAAAAASVLALPLIRFGRVPTEWIIGGPFAFRPAATSTAVGHLAATALQLVVFWGLFLVVLPLAIAFFENRWAVGIPFVQFLAPAGAVILVLASVLGLSTAVAMSTIGRGTPLPSAMATRLVVVGPYRYLRNPMAVAGIVQGAAVGLILSSWLVVVYALIGSLLWNYAVRPLEEADLDERFGEEYRHYCASVRCWVPRIPVVRYTPDLRRPA